MRNLQNYNSFTYEDRNIRFYNKPVGRGRYAAVYRGKWSRNNDEEETVAYKIQRKEKKGQTDRVNKEVELHKHLKHSSIVELKDAFEYGDNYYIVLEYCNKGTLEEYLKEREFSEFEVYDIMKQIVEGLKYLHNKKIIHRDLSLKNILLTECHITGCLKVKIADFGISTKLSSSDETKQTFVGTPVSMSPEIVAGNKYSFEVDIWSLGVVLYALLFGDFPIKGQSMEEVFAKIYLTKLNIPYSDNFEASNLLCLLLNKKPERRPDIYAISNHNFFKKYDYSPEISKHKMDGSGAGSLPNITRDSGVSSYNPEKNFQKLRPSENNEDYHLKSRYLNFAKIKDRECHRVVKGSEMPPRISHLKNNYCLPDRNLENFSFEPIEKSTEKQVRGQKNKNCFSERKSHSNPNLAIREESSSSQCDSCLEKSAHSPYTSSQLSRMSRNEQISEDYAPPKEDRSKYIIDTVRLPPCKHKTKTGSAIYSISGEGQAIAEYYKVIKKTNCVKYVIAVSPDNGEYIGVFDPGHRKYTDGDPDRIPDFYKNIKLFTITNLPDKHWKKYMNLKKFVDSIRERTPKIIVYKKEVKCSMMENFPNPSFEIKFSEGWSIKKRGSEMIKLQNEQNQTITEKDVDKKYLFMCEEMIKKCQWAHDVLLYFEQNGLAVFFPAILGERGAFLQALKNSDVAHYKSGENKQISYSNSINTVSSSKQKDRKYEECKKRYLCEIKDTIKKLWVEGDYVIIQYGNGYELQSSLDAEKVMFKNWKTGERNIEWKSSDCLRQRINHDLKIILMLLEHNRTSKENKFTF